MLYIVSKPVVSRGAIERANGKRALKVAIREMGEKLECVVVELPVAPTWLFRSAEVLKVALHRVTGMAVAGDIATGI